MPHPLLAAVVSLLARALTLPEGAERESLLREALELTRALARD